MTKLEIANLNMGKYHYSPINKNEKYTDENFKLCNPQDDLKKYIDHLDKNYMEIKSLIGFVPQEYNFNQFEKVIDVIVNQAGYYGIIRSDAMVRAEFFLKLFGLWGKRNNASMKLSGGMKRRLMIVRALIHNPKILILDEPTAGVDIISRHLIWKFLKDINRLYGITIILTTHYLEEVEYLCKNVAIINHGKILVNTEVNNLFFRFGKKEFILKVNIGGIDNFIKNNVDYEFTVLNNSLIEVIIPKNKNLNDLFMFLVSCKIIVYDIKEKSNRLERLFIDLVGNS